MPLSLAMESQTAKSMARFGSSYVASRESPCSDLGVGCVVGATYAVALGGEVSLSDLPRVVVLVGPTGVGKSKLAMALVESFGGEIVSADSMQVYRYMDIGTAKPSRLERERFPHHLIDVVFPDEPFHAGLYRKLGREVIERLAQEGKPVWVVGGTGLYVKALIQGIFQAPEIDPGIRQRLKEEGEKRGGAYLFERLREVDPETASKLHPNDRFRIVRALEVYESTGIPISVYRKDHAFREKPYRTLKIGLTLDRKSLNERIDRRVDEMIEKGFLDEVKGLLEMGYGPQLKPMQGLGYKHLSDFLLGKMGWDEALRQIKRDTRRYAKRQMTWFRADPEIKWFDITRDRETIYKEVGLFLKERGGEDGKGQREHTGSGPGPVSQSCPQGTDPCGCGVGHRREARRRDRGV